MNSIVKVISTKIDSTKRRLIKYLRFGSSDVQESLEVSSYGIDSNPIPEMVALYSTTSEIGKPVIIGYINKNKVADVGEFRVFSTDDKGGVKTFVHLKNDGVMCLGGDSDNAVKYSELEKAFNQLKSDHDKLAQKWTKFCLGYVPGSPSVPGAPVTLATETVQKSTASITPAKNENIKTN